MNEALRDIIETFRSVDAPMRMELLLDYSKKLPPLPERLREAKDAGEHRVHECMTPVFMWVERDRETGALRIYADVTDEAPTVKGFVSLLVSAVDGRPPEAALELPGDLIEQLQLQEIIRMNRMVGLTAVLSRVRREAASAAA